MGEFVLKISVCDGCYKHCIWCYADVLCCRPTTTYYYAIVMAIESVIKTKKKKTFTSLPFYLI